MSALIKYDAACHALAEAVALDEVKDIRDKASAMQAYARQAKNKQLEVDASEIRIRAERRLGEILIEQKADGGLATGGQPYQATPTGNGGVEILRPTLADAGIDYNLSSRAQAIAGIPEEEFEGELARHREEQQAVTGRTMERLAKKGEAITPPDQDAEMRTEMLNDALDALRDENDSLRNQVAAMLFDGSDEERAEYLSRLNFLTEKNKQLEILNRGLIEARDRVMRENASLKRQGLYAAKKLKEFAKNAAKAVSE